MVCPLCGERRARRGCPALGKQICSVCCGTKRLVQIACPDDCPYLTTAREHPAAAVARKQQLDVDRVVEATRDLNQRQSQLFLLVASVLVQYESPELHRLTDDDVAQAAGALAGTFETSSRGVIYEHRPASLPAERLVTALKHVLAEAEKNPTSAFERDAGVVLRRIEKAARQVRATEPSSRPALIDLLARLMRPPKEESTGKASPEPPRLIVP